TSRGLGAVRFIHVAQCTTRDAGAPSRHGSGAARPSGQPGITRMCGVRAGAPSRSWGARAASDHGRT
ncbi:hypothetical protein CN300_31985, partial [Bacillus thuringiensis]